MKLKQCQIERIDGDTVVREICWLDASKARKGNEVTLKDHPTHPAAWWKIVVVSEGEMEKSEVSRKSKNPYLSVK